ncbi:LPXTG cell wall anchor domain-containing protein [Streptococcus ruminantium]|uniref:LPXTG cell wall anchor domain-containing protein n=1 Tax=Streptococcus ruminantium TaxID=1917441 RepID=A0ABU1B5Z7_9STRE|nr:LPXTG cell wall anchor domain-containing protein [Streptococcus ruminantium]MDQ8759390.1 LPXTG cell wall anchor domain-containing protein [Streptococcus ruminantium]MDQ8769745.1 LPXTG cell wall anchor domain-containing protein [Streptococcus ruminantium]MDQ8774483.1 LPXTG cell wall anchor domain-containing protein [Streptococcus ruminantium]MDQ8794974.1 LPXTG cell wall anchor domain-containing protein [Streptococcus ruminantium]MDQ8795869.1 LPXTG cell wall anchor domain-containing protein [
MDKLKKKQCYSLRKIQMGVGSVLLATVLLTAGTTRADSVIGREGGSGLTETEALKQEAPKKEEKPSSSGHSNSNSGTQATYRLFAKVEGKGAEEIDKDTIKSKDDRDRAEKKVIEDNKEKYPYVDRIEKGNDLVLLFSEYKTNIVLRTVNSDDDKREIQYSFYKKEADLKAHLEEVKKGWADNYDVEQKEEIGEDKVKTVTLIFTKRGLKPQVTPQPEKPQDDKKPSVPSTPEVAPKPGDKPSVPSKPEVAPKPDAKPSVPSKPEVAPKPDAKPSVPSIPEMVPEPEKLEMDKSMKVVPGKPEKATPEAQVPEAQVPQVQVPQPQTPQLPSPKEEVAKAQQQPRAIQSSAPAKSGGKQLPNTGEAASILTLVGSGMLGLLGLAFTKKRKTK